MGEFVLDVERHTSSWEQHSIDLWKEGFQLSLCRFVEDGNDLPSCHFNKLDVGGSDVGVISRAILCVDSDDRGLSAEGGEGQEEEEEMGSHEGDYWILLYWMGVIQCNDRGIRELINKWKGMIWRW